MDPSEPTRVLFQARNRRGLGHLMRGLNIAREIRVLAPDAAISFYTRSAAAQPLCEDFGCYVEPDANGMLHWQDAVNAVAPHVIVYDTMLPLALSGVANQHVASVFIMRRCKVEEQHRVLHAPILREMDYIIVPHSPDEFGFEVPAELQARTHFVGPIVRPLHAHIQANLRQRYQLNPHEFVLVSTVGGGGFENQAHHFFEIVCNAHRLLQATVPNLRHIVVCGPNFGQTLTAEPGMTLVTFEPELSNLFALAQLVIAEGGYNTVNEIRLSKTPALFLPSDRKLDDQAQRVSALVLQGLAEMGDLADPAATARMIAQLCANPQRLADLRVAYTHDHLATGNAVAAAHILRLRMRRTRTTQSEVISI